MRRASPRTSENSRQACRSRSYRCHRSSQWNRPRFPTVRRRYGCCASDSCADTRGSTSLWMRCVSCRDRGVDARLTIAGEVWEDAGAWTKRVNDPEVKDAVTFVDHYLPDAEVVQIVSEHHILLAPYRSATQSGVLPLALATGRPVVRDGCRRPPRGPTRRRRRTPGACRRCPSALRRD